MPVSLNGFSSNGSAGRDSSPILRVCHKKSVQSFAPIALFVYNRPEHTRRTVEALRANHLARQSDLFVFADASKNKSGAAAVGAVRKFIRAIDGFKSVTLIEREHNCGLSKSVITAQMRNATDHGFGQAAIMFALD